MSREFSLVKLLNIISYIFHKIEGKSYEDAYAYLKVKDVDRRLSLKNIYNNMLILDVGGGLGLDDLIFAYKGALPIVIDLDYNTLLKGKSFSKVLQLYDKIEYVVADALRLPFRDACFNMVASFSAIEHLPNKRMWKIWVKEMVRVLKNNGKFILTTSNKFWLMYPIAKLLIALKKRPSEYFFSPHELSEELMKNNIVIKKFDAGIIYYRGYSIIPSLIPFSDKLDNILEYLLNILEKKEYFKILCGRIGFCGIKKLNKLEN